MAVSLTEQMGVIAVVDALRHQQIALNELMNLPAHKRAVAEQIAAYYRSQKIDASPELIDAGVNAYFADRLTPSFAKGSWLARGLAFLHLNRRRMIYRPAITIMLIGVVAIAALEGHEAVTMRRQAAQLAQWGATAEAVGEAIDEVNQAVERLASKAKVDSTPAADSMLKQAIYNARDAKEALDAGAGWLDAARFKVDAHGEFETVLQSAQDDIGAANELVKRAEAYTGATGSILNIASKHKMLQERAPTVFEVATIKALSGDIERQLQDPNFSNPGALQAEFDQLMSVIAFNEQYLRLQSEAADIGLSPADERVIAALAASVDEAIGDLNGQRIKSTLADFQGAVNLAGTTLTFSVVDEPGVRSGVERTYDASGGQAWYLIVDALGADGRAIEVPIKSAESGRTRMASRFGVRVSKDEYERTKQDKLSDGIVNNKDMGGKPKGTLRFDFGPRAMSETPDLIVEW